LIACAFGSHVEGGASNVVSFASNVVSFDLVVDDNGNIKTVLVAGL
jgi:hypothetical protein